ncbi:MAG: response regulator [Gammaproteobacteria bacterium]|nr:response regulator [Gammaproteobacteria bacterium]
MLNNEILNDVIQSLGVGIALYDAERKFVFSNQQFLDLFAFENAVDDSIDSVTGATSTDSQESSVSLYSGADSDEWTRQFIDQAENDSARDYQIRRADGRFFVGSLQATGLDGYLITIRDTTEQIRAEQAERESDMLLRKIVDACPATFLVSRIADGKIIYCPPGSRERFGEIDSTLSFFLKPEDREAYLQALLPTGTLDNFRVKFLRGDGSIMDGLTSARVTDYKGEDVIVSSTRDITELLVMQEELEQQKSIAHQNEKVSALGSLLAGVAHELNNPLSVVLGYSYMLQNQVENPSEKRRVDRLAQAAERCAKIIKTFLSMARQRPTLIENCSINDVIDIALDITEYSINSIGISIQQNYGTNLPMVAVDQDQMAQVFTNLIVNAEQALVGVGSNGVLSIRTYHDSASNKIVIEVEDNGVGIPSEIKDRIFEPFFTTKDVGEGTGVGLAFSHRIISSHGGNLSVTSEPGHGACFKVSLPLNKNSPTDEPSITSKRPNQAGTTKVLIVDDESAVANMLSELLEVEGYQVITKNDAGAALALLETQDFNVILSDIKMPGIDGADFFDAIQDQFPEYVTSTGFVTGDTLSQRVADLLEQSKCPYIEKPVSPDALFDLVEQLSQQKESSS